MHRLRRYRYGLAGVAAGAALWAADVTANDEWDDVALRWRRRVASVSPFSSTPARKPRVVILGTGWGACAYLRKLDVDRFDVTVVSPRNYFTYTPLLCGTTVGTVEPRSVVEPIRALCARSGAASARYLQATCESIDVDRSTVSCRDTSGCRGDVETFTLEYDHLVVAVGARPNTFGIPGVKENALFLKEVEHCDAIRDRVSDLLETASLPGQSEETQRRLLHFVVVGAGPTGVEFAAELHDLLREDIPAYFPALDASKVQITLIEAMPHVLGAFDETLRAYTEEQFARSAIAVRKKTMVTKVDEDAVTVRLPAGGRSGSVAPPAGGGPGPDGGPEHETVPYGLLVWVAGIGTRPLVARLAAEIGDAAGQTSRRGLVVDGRMRVAGVPRGNVFAVGDCAVSGHPPTAQVASQQGRYLARLFNRAAARGFVRTDEGADAAATARGAETSKGNVVGAAEDPLFAYGHRGSFAYVGSSRAVAQIPRPSSEGRPPRPDDLKMSGQATYAAWRAVYFSKLLSLRNRCLVAGDWIKAKLFGRDMSRTSGPSDARNLRG
jgi:NADH:ubiquinone reductase (non-electrogenic)